MISLAYRLALVGETMFPLAYGLQDEGSRRGIVQPHTPLPAITVRRTAR